MNSPHVLCAFILCSIPALLAQPNVTAWEVLNSGLHDKNPDHRKQAVTAAGSIGLTPESIQAVENALKDDDPVVRQTAAAELGQMKSRQSIPALRTALDDPSGEVAFTAARTLWELGDRSPDEEETLQDVMTGQERSSVGVVDGAVRDARAKLRNKRALIKMGINEASGALLGPFSIGVIAAEEFLKDSGAAGRALAATLLAQKCDDRNLQLFEWSLREDKNPAVKAAVAKAIGQCGNKDSIPLLEQQLSNSHTPLRYMSAASIVRLTQPGREAPNSPAPSSPATPAPSAPPAASAQ